MTVETLTMSKDEHVCIILVVICFSWFLRRVDVSSDTISMVCSVSFKNLILDKWKSKAMGPSCILCFDMSSVFLQSSMTPTGRLGRLNTFCRLNQTSLNFQSIFKWLG